MSLLLFGQSETGTSQYVRRFNEASLDEYIKTAVGTVDPTGGITYAAMVRQLARDVDAAPFFIERSDGGFVSSFQILTDGRLQFSNRGTAGGSVSTITAPLNGWTIVVVTKGTGNVVPRFHVYDFILDTWTHGDGTIPVGTPTSAATNLDIGLSFQGNIGVVGVWNSALIDSEVQALSANLATSDWYSHVVGPSALWQLNQTAITTTLVDRTGGLANETSKVGTSVNFIAVPWQFGIVSPSLLLPSPTLLPSGGLLPGSLLDIQPAGIPSAEQFGSPFITKSEDYPAAVIADGPSGYWRLAGPGSTVVADIGPNGTFQNAPAEVTGLIRQSTNTAHQFVAGSSQRATIPDNTATDLGDVFTLETWLSLPSLGISGDILYQDGNGPGIRYDAINQRFTLAQAGVDKYRFDYIPNANQSIHIVVAKNGATVSASINGIPVTVNTLSATTYTNGTAFYFASNNASSYFSVTLDEVAVYKTALTSADAFDHFEAGGVAQVLVPGIPSEEQFGTPLLPRTLLITGIDSEEQFGNLAIVGPGEIQASGIPSQEQFGTHFVGYIVVPANDLLRRLVVVFDESPYTLTIDEPGGNALVLEIDPNP